MVIVYYYQVIFMNIKEELFELQDIKYKEFQAKLVPNIDSDSIIGIRTPDLRNLHNDYLKRKK